MRAAVCPPTVESYLFHDHALQPQLHVSTVALAVSSLTQQLSYHVKTAELSSLLPAAVPITQSLHQYLQMLKLQLPCSQLLYLSHSHRINVHRCLNYSCLAVSCRTYHSFTDVSRKVTFPERRFPERRFPERRFPDSHFPG